MGFAIMQKKKEKAVEFGFCCKKKVSKHKKEGLDIRKASKTDVLCKKEIYKM